MDVILLEHVSRLGNVGEVVAVKAGYGRNFLIPTGKAVRATKTNVAEIAAKREALEKQNAEKRDAAQSQAKALEGLSVKIVRQASEDGKLFGSVAVRDVVAALKEKGQEFNRQQVDLDGAIKSLGLYKANITLHPEVKVTCMIEVVRSLEASAYDELEQEEAEDVQAAPEVEAVAEEEDTAA